MGKISEALSGSVSKLLGSRGHQDDPLSSIKSVTRWVQNLPVGDAVKAHQELLNEITRFNENVSDFSATRLEILMLLDEKAQDIQTTLVYQYLRNPRMAKAIESQLWHSIYNLDWEVVRGYHSFTLGFSRSPAKSKLEPFIPLITLRAIRGFRRLIKWRFIRYQHPGEKIWLRLHNLYSFAESEGFEKRPLRAYPDDAAESTCEQEYLHGLMLDQSNSGSLYPRQIDLIDRWLENWRAKLTLTKSLNSDIHVFVVDTSEDHGARRIRNKGPEGSSRYWSTMELLARLKTIRARLREGDPPARVGLTEDARVAESMDLIEQLERQWAPLSQREQRRKPRQAVKRVVEIVPGLSSMIAHIKESKNNAPDNSSFYTDNMRYDEAADMHVYGFVTDRTRERASQAARPPSMFPDSEHWVMEDESECGYGTTIETHDKDWLRVGALVGVKPIKSKTWSIGVVRRLSRFGKSQSSVGIETLPEKPELVMLHAKKSAAYEVNGIDTSGTERPIAALILHGENRSSLIFDPSEYAHKRMFEYSSLNEKQLIRLEDMGERGEGWIRVDFSHLN
jgi:cyclic-di-GMP-binding protein